MKTMKANKFANVWFLWLNPVQQKTIAAGLNLPNTNEVRIHKQSNGLFSVGTPYAWKHILTPTDLIKCLMVIPEVAGMVAAATLNVNNIEIYAL